jgi:hypothetical protein
MGNVVKTPDAGCDAHHGVEQIAMPPRPKPDAFAAIIRALFGRYVSDGKIEALRRDLTRAGASVSLSEAKGRRTICRFVMLSRSPLGGDQPPA